MQKLHLTEALINNGSSLNVIPMTTLPKLPTDFSYMKKSHLVVRTFDGIMREVMRNIELPIQIGSCTFNIEFQVMDINPSYNRLLEKPWIKPGNSCICVVFVFFSRVMSCLRCYIDLTHISFYL